MYVNLYFTNPEREKMIFNDVGCVLQSLLEVTVVHDLFCPDIKRIRQL